MCDCKSDIEARLLERFKELEPTATDHEVSLGGYAYVFGKEAMVKGYLPINQTAKFPLKKGGMKERKTQANMTFTYCPFCGVKYE